MGTGALTAAVGGSAALLLLSLACIVATVIVYFALVVRKVLIVVTAIFAPLAFAGSLADITVSWTRRWIETTVALIVSKLILILIFVAGYGILIEGVGQAGSGATQKVTQVISGVLVLFLAGFAPWSALKIVHFTGEHAHQIHSLGSSTVAGAAAGGRMAQKAAPYFSPLGGTGRRRCRRSHGRVRARRRDRPVPADRLTADRAVEPAGQEEPKVQAPRAEVRLRVVPGHRRRLQPLRPVPTGPNRPSGRCPSRGRRPDPRRRGAHREHQTRVARLPR